MARPQPGDPAPDFELEGTAGRFRLSEQHGRRVVLLFYPGDETPVCTRQFCSYRDREEDFARLEAVVVGVSAQGLESHRSFAANHGLEVPLLADEGGKVARLYGAWRPVVGTKRAVVIVDEEGTVRFRHDHALGLDFMGVDELREALASVPAAT